MSNVSHVSNSKIFNLNSSIQTPNIKSSTHLLDSLKADPMIHHKRKLSRAFKAIPVEQVTPLLDEFFQFVAKEGNKVDIEKTMKRLAEILPLTKLQDAIRLQYPDHLDALNAAKSMIKEAEFYLEITEDKKSFPLIAKLRSVLDAIITCLESIIEGFGIAEFFKPHESDEQSSSRAQRVFVLFSLFGILTTALLPVLGAAVTAPIIGGTLLVLATLSLIYPRIKPMPHRINKTVNWTKEIQNGRLSVVKTNKQCLDKIAQALITGKRVKTHPMLIGKSGIGKTETAKAFAKAVADGAYPELKGKKVFYINCADLLSGGARQNAGNKELQKISEAMGRHRKNIILVLDEIHILCQKKNNVLAEQLKTLLDDAHEGFSNVVGITTQQEFYRDIYRHNAAFARRFKQINIDFPTDDEVKNTLSRTLIQRAPSALIDDNMLSYLLAKTKIAFPDAPQPATSIKILSQCIKQTSDSQKSSMEEEMDGIRRRIDILTSENVMSQGGSLLPHKRENHDQTTQLESELANLEERFETYKLEVEKLYQQKDKLGQVRKKTYQNIRKISKLKDKQIEKNKGLLAEYLLQSHFFSPAVEENIRHAANEFEIQAIINQELVDKVIEEEKENHAKVQQAIRDGKEDIEARENGTEANNTEKVEEVA